MTEYPVVYDHTSASLGVLCVKSEGEPFQTGPFTVAGVENRFLRDNRTGLMWMKKNAGCAEGLERLLADVRQCPRWRLW